MDIDVLDILMTISNDLIFFNNVFLVLLFFIVFLLTFILVIKK